MMEYLMNNSVGFSAIGAGIAVGFAALATGIAEKRIGSTAVKSFSVKEELFGKGLIMTVIPETIVIFGFVIAIMIIKTAGLF